MVLLLLGVWERSTLLYCGGLTWGLRLVCWSWIVTMMRTYCAQCDALRYGPVAKLAVRFGNVACIFIFIYGKAASCKIPTPRSTYRTHQIHCIITHEMPNVPEVVSKIRSGSNEGQALKSCDHSSPDCPHGDNVNQNNIPWASGTQKHKPTDGSANNAADQLPRESSSKGQPTDDEVKDAEIPHAAESNTGKESKIWYIQM